MIFLEDKLRPRDDEQSSYLRDGMVWALLAAMFVALLPVWWIDRTLAASLGGGQLTDFGDVIEHFSRLLLSFWLLPALGFMLALRCGAIDLSVWTTAGLGGVVSAVMISCGYGVAVSMAAGMGAGVAYGIVNGVLVAGLGLPCPLVSVLMSFGLIHWMTGEFGAGEIVLENGAMGGLLKGFQNSSDWLGLPEVTLQSAAALLIFGLYAVTMLVVLNGEMIERRDHRGFSERWRLFAALIASGALSAAGGVLWLVEHESAPIPGRLFDDMIIPAAALLAGGLYLGGSGRTLLACVLLPGALAVVTGWRQEVLSLRSDYLVGYPLQLGVLVVMVASARYAMTCAAATTRCRAGAMALAWSSSLGIAVFAASVWGDSPIVRAIFHVAGAGIWFLGGIGALLLRLTEPRRVRTDEFATAELLA